MYYVVEERNVLGDLVGVVILLLIVQWEFDTLVELLPGILAFLIATFALCTVVIRLAQETGMDGRLIDISAASINPFASIARAVDAVALALPSGPYRCVGPLSDGTEDVVLIGGSGGLLAFGSACYATGALTSWQRTGHWSPLVPSLAAVAGAAAGAWCARAARRRPGRTLPHPPSVPLLDRPGVSLPGLTAVADRRITDEIA